MEKYLIIETIGPAVKDRGCFIVDVTVSKDNDIVLTIEKETGDVDLDDCVALNDAFLAAFDKDVEDYSLTVSSAGLDQPFKVSGQFTKATGSQVVVLLKGGRKLTGILTSADDESITLRYVTKEIPEGKKRPVKVDVDKTFSMDEVKSTKYVLNFK